jgi:hypothetical protein
MFDTEKNRAGQYQRSKNNISAKDNFPSVFFIGRKELKIWAKRHARMLIRRKCPSDGIRLFREKIVWRKYPVLKITERFFGKSTIPYININSNKDNKTPVLTLSIMS